MAAPPYDVIDDAQRAELVARSPHNVVEIDLPRADGDPYAHAAEVFARLAARRRPGPRRAARDLGARAGLHRPRRASGAPATACSRAWASRTTARARSARTSARTPGPKEDRLRLTRATQANLSPIFSLYDDPSGAAWGAVAPHVEGAPWGEVTDEDGTVHRLWRVADPERRRRRHRRAGRRRAADRRRPPPLRDRARLRAGGRRRPRADVPRRAPGPRADRLPHPPADHRARPGRAREALRAAIERDWEVAPVDAARARADGRRPGADRLLRRPPQAPADAHAARPGDRRRGAARTSPSPTAGSTPRCSRR